MAPVGQDGFGYEIGSGEKFNQAIGQIMVNHSTCDWAIRGLFLNLLGSPSEHAEALIDSQNMKAPSMAKTILAILKTTNNKYPEQVKEHISSALKTYQTYSSHRNIIAHWNWLPITSDEKSATLRNPMKSDTDESKGTEAQYSLQQLQDIGLAFAEVATEITLMGHLLHVQEDFLIKKAIEQASAVMLQVRGSLSSLPDLPPED